MACHAGQNDRRSAAIMASVMALAMAASDCADAMAEGRSAARRALTAVARDVDDLPLRCGLGRGAAMSAEMLTPSCWRIVHMKTVSAALAARNMLEGELPSARAAPLSEAFSRLGRKLVESVDVSRMSA
jgi:hypothetical protein